MKTHCGLSFEKFFLILILPVVLSGCAAAYPVLMAAQFVPTAIVAASYLPKGTEIEMSEEKGGVIDRAAMQKISSAITNDVFIHEYFSSDGDGVFDTVKLTKRDAPVGPSGASKIARDNSVDSYIMVSLIPGGVQHSLLGPKVLLGGATVSVVTASGNVVYKQTVKLMKKGRSSPNMSGNEAGLLLVRAISDDMKKDLVANVATSENQGLVVGDATSK